MTPRYKPGGAVRVRAKRNLFYEDGKIVLQGMFGDLVGCKDEQCIVTWDAAASCDAGVEHQFTGKVHPNDIEFVGIEPENT